jgi:hypothetical protein
MNRRNLIAALVFSVCLLPNAEAQQPALDIKVKADKKVAELPSGPLFWRVETLPTAAEAQAASSSHSLMVETLGKVWLFLGQHHAAGPRSPKWGRSQRSRPVSISSV